MPLIAAGLSFHTAPLAVRERAALTDAGTRQLLRYLVGHSGLSGAVALSTCNRTELYVSSAADDLSAEVVPRMSRYLDPGGRAGIGDHLVAFQDAAAVEHLFRVAAGLESMILGEAQVLGQVKSAHRLAQEAGTLDARLDFVVRRSISAAKRVRTQTSIGRGAGSISEAAVTAAAELLGSLAGSTVLLIGAGKMSVLAARRLRRMGAHLRVSSRGGDSASALAGELGATVVTVKDLVAAAMDCDVVIASTTSAEPVLDAAAVAAIQEERQGRPLCLIDIAVPRDIDPGAAGVPGVTLIDIDDLGRNVEGALSRRQRAVVAAEAIVAEELARTMTVIDERDATAPTIRALLARAEALRRREVERTLARTPSLDALTAERIDQLTRSLVKKLLHAPLSHLREAAGDPSVALRLRDAFDLDEVDPATRRETREPR